MNQLLTTRRQRIHRLMLQAAKDGQSAKVAQAAYLLNRIDEQLFFLTSFKN